MHYMRTSKHQMLCSAAFDVRACVHTNVILIKYVGGTVLGGDPGGSNKGWVGWGGEVGGLRD